MRYFESRLNYAVSSDGRGVNHATCGYDGNRWMHNRRQTRSSRPSGLDEELETLAKLCDAAVEGAQESCDSSFEVTALAVATDQVIDVDEVRDRRYRQRLRVEVRPPGMRSSVVTLGGTGAWVTTRLSVGRASEFGRRATDAASAAVDARPVEPGRMAVVLSPVAAGVLAHETWGHLLETERENRPDWITTGEKDVATDTIRICDDPTLPGGWGTYAVDDVGATPKAVDLVVGGGVATDIASSPGRMRRASWRHRPMARMTNTLVRPSGETVDASTLCTMGAIRVNGVSGGAVDPNTGRFVFHANSGERLDRDGRSVHMLKPFSIGGRLDHLFRQVIGVGDDDEVAPASCVKNGQRVWVGVGGCSLALEDIDVA